MIVYLDLDRTLFQTSESLRIWEKINELYPEIDAKTNYRARSAFYEYVGDQYYHDMTAQLESLGLVPDLVYDELRATELADGRMEYPGLLDLIRKLQNKQVEVKVLTFGPDDYQRFKASLCPSLNGIEVLTTLSNKATVLDIAQEECWIVDDKPIGDELPGNVSFVQVSMEGKEVMDEIWPVFTSLEQVKEFFDEVL